MQHCSQCGAANSAQSSECHSCGAPLDEIEAEVVSTLEPETSRYREFALQVRAYQEGRLTRQEFGHWLEHTRALMDQRRDEYVALIRDAELEDVDVSRVNSLESLNSLQVNTTGYFQEREEEVTMAMEGIFDIEAAMSQMMEFATDESVGDSVLAIALRKMWEGNEKCNEAIRMNRVFRERLLQGV